MRRNIQVIEPQPAQQFWSSQNAQGGIYVIIAGKVRLIHSQNERVLSLKAGDFFGELTLFPEKSFEPYSAKAARDVHKLCLIPNKYLSNLIRKDPKIREHLHHQAVLRDSQLRGTNTPTADEKKSEKTNTFPDRQLPIEPKN